MNSTSLTTKKSKTSAEPAQNANRDDPQRRTNWYGPITRRLNSDNNPISLETFKGLHQNQVHKMSRDLN